MQIVLYPHPALHYRSVPITEISPELSDVVRRMFELMYEAKGIGLAANQVGLPYRLFVLNLTADPAEKDEEHVFINPNIVQRRGTQIAEEGCLSLPKLYADVRRAKEVTVEAFDLSGQGFELTVDGLAARAIQHETDHLDGVMFTERLTEHLKDEVRSSLKDFESHFDQQQELGLIPCDDQIFEQLEKLAKSPVPPMSELVTLLETAPRPIEPEAKSPDEDSEDESESGLIP